MRMNFSNAQKSMTTVGLTAVGLVVVLIAFVFAVFTPQQVLFAQSEPEFDLGGDFSGGSSDAPSTQVPSVVVPPPTAAPAPPPTPTPPSPSEKTEITTISLLFARATDVLNAIVPFIIGLAILVIIWGILGYISHAGEEEKRQEAKQFVVWNIVALFIMLSIWGLVNVLVGSFALNNDIPAGALTPSLPCIPDPPTVTCE